MSLIPALAWKSPDRSDLINSRIRDVFGKGFVTGGLISPVVGLLQVNVAAFTCVNIDGMVVRSDAIVNLAVTDSVVNYIVLRAVYVFNGSPVLQMQVLTATQYSADPDQPHLHILGTVDLTTGTHTQVGAGDIHYELRDIVDVQARTSWREPVASMGALPVPPGDMNRDGDMRLALDTHTIWVWSEMTEAWNTFDDVSVQNHRLHEHVNGITGDSAVTTLQPTTSGTNIQIAGVPAGSGYTVDGLYLNAPLVTTTIAASSVGATRGLIQVAVDQTGAVVGTYRVTKDADPLDIAAAQVVDISDNHVTGSFTLLFNPAGNVITWGAGPPVAIAVPGTGVNRYRLFTDTAIQWIDIQVAAGSTLPGTIVSDNYTILAEAQNATHLLIAYYFWAGATTLFLGQDHRTFGTTGTQDLSTQFLHDVLGSQVADLRGLSVFSGGTTTGIGTSSVKVTGPVVGYVNGQRIPFPGSTTGVAVSGTATWFVYGSVIAGVPTLVVSTAGPGVGDLPIASLAVVTGTINTITDLRSSLLRASGDADLRWEESTSILHAEKNGADAGLTFQAGTVASVNNVFKATTGPLALVDTNTGSPGIKLSSTINTSLAGLQPGILSANQSLLGALQPLATLGLSRGVENPTGGGLLATAGGLTVTIAPGFLKDGFGRRCAQPTGAPTLSITQGANALVVIYWDASTQAFATVTQGTGIGINDEPIAIALVNGGNTGLTALVDIRRAEATNQTAREVTVQASGAANFTSLRTALLWTSCFTLEARPINAIRFTGDHTEPSTDGTYCIDITTGVGFGTNLDARLSNLIIAGTSTQFSPYCTVSFNGGLINGGNTLSSWYPLDVFFTNTAGVNVTNHDLTVFRDWFGPIGTLRCRFQGGTHVDYRSLATCQYGGAQETKPGTHHVNTSFTNIASLYYIGGTSRTATGQVHLDDCYVFNCGSLLDTAPGALTTAGQFRYEVTGTVLDTVSVAIATTQTNITTPTFNGITLQDCVLSGTTIATGATFLERVRGLNATVTLSGPSALSDCQINAAGNSSVTASGFASIDRSNLTGLFVSTGNKLSITDTTLANIVGITGANAASVLTLGSNVDAFLQDLTINDVSVGTSLATDACLLIPAAGSVNVQGNRVVINAALTTPHSLRASLAASSGTIRFVDSSFSGSADPVVTSRSAGSAADPVTFLLERCKVLSTSTTTTVGTLTGITINNGGGVPFNAVRIRTCEFNTFATFLSIRDVVDLEVSDFRLRGPALSTPYQVLIGDGASQPALQRDVKFLKNQIESVQGGSINVTDYGVSNTDGNVVRIENTGTFVDAPSSRNLITITDNGAHPIRGAYAATSKNTLITAGIGAGINVESTITIQCQGTGRFNTVQTNDNILFAENKATGGTTKGLCVIALNDTASGVIQQGTANNNSLDAVGGSGVGVASITGPTNHVFNAGIAIGNTLETSNGVGSNISNFALGDSSSPATGPLNICK